MAEIILDEIEEKNRKTGKRVSYTVHAILFLLLFIPFFSFPDPPPGMAGVLVNLGMPDQGQGSDNAPPPKRTASATKPTPPPPPTKSEPVKPKPTPPPPKSKPEPVKEKPATKEVVTAENNEIAIRREKERKEKERQRQEEIKEREEELKKKREEQLEEAKERERAQKKQQEADRKRQEAEEAERRAEEAEARRKAEAKRKADAEAKRRADAKAKAEAEAAGLFGGGAGKGNTGKPGNQGRQDGDPDGNALEGISTGAGGQVSGFGSRGVTPGPKPSDNSQATGVVVVRVCVDASGKVISATYTQKGSTTSDSRLRAIAEKNAKRFKFAKGPVDKQCGYITYDFRVR